MKKREIRSIIMKISVIKEIKVQEYRVGLTPAHTQAFVQNGHTVYIEKDAGIGSGFENSEYEEAGALIVDTATAWNEADIIVKVKEPLNTEYQYFREGLIIYTYLHLASNIELIEALKASKVIAIGYETVELANGSLPLLTPMSEIAGRMATQVGAHFLEKTQGGRGILLSGVPGAERGRVVIIGGGTVGINAAKIAAGLGAKVLLIDRNIDKLRMLETLFGNKVELILSTPKTVREKVIEADLVIGAVLVAGAKAPKIVSEEVVKEMKKGSVIVDVAIDQGGCIETMDHYTTHDAPTFVKHDVIHYAVANMPGSVARTATIALTNVTTTYLHHIANLGYKDAIETYPELAKGVNIEDGRIVYPAVQEALDEYNAKK